LSHPVVHRRYPPGLLAAIVVSSLAGRRRSFLRDAAALAATFHPALLIAEPGTSPRSIRSDKLLIVFNHYSCPGTPAWWTACALGGAFVQVGLTDPEPRWVMTDTLNYMGRLAPLSHWMLRRIALTFDAFPMPPMPPAPQDVQACAATVRRVIVFAHEHPVAHVCLAPEGRDSGDGSLIAPPSGAGRFILQLCRVGMTILPTGVCKDGGAWQVRFGATFTLAAPEGLSADERDEWASRRVMDAIAGLLPSRLRGAYQASL